MDMENLLRTLCAAPGVGGQEDDAAAAARRFLEPLGRCEISPLGSLLCEVHPEREGGPRLMLDAHLDQIGMIVTAVLEDGGLLGTSPSSGGNRRKSGQNRVLFAGYGLEQ